MILHLTQPQAPPEEANMVRKSTQFLRKMGTEMYGLRDTHSEVLNGQHKVLVEWWLNIHVLARTHTHIYS